MIQDIRHGLRLLLKNPGFTAIAALTLALGIGANTAIFNLLDTLLLRTLPVRQPGRLVLFGDGTWAGSTDGFPDSSCRLFSYPFFREALERNKSMSGLAAVLSLRSDLHATIGGRPEAEAVTARLVSGTYFPTLGVGATLGRVLTESDDLTPGAHPVAVASYAWWKRRFNLSPSVVGSTITVRSTVYTIVGVAAPEFFGTRVGESPDLWIPLAMEAQISPGWNGLKNNLFQSLYIIGRLKPGVTMAQAGADVNLVFQQVLRDYAGTNPGAAALKALKGARIDLTPAAGGIRGVGSDLSAPLWILMTVVGLVLLVACANLANLLLAKATSREREISVRLAIGASRGRLVRQLLTESLLLSLLGGVAAVTMASWTGHAVLGLVAGGPDSIPLEGSMNFRLLAFGLALSAVAALVIGIAPALRASRMELAGALKGARGAASARERGFLGRALVIGQVTVSLALIIGAGLFLRSLVNITSVDTGFKQENALVLNLDASSAGYSEDARLGRLYDEIEQRVQALPGVASAAFSFFTFNEGGWTEFAFAKGYTPTSANDNLVWNNVVGPDYFTAMGLPVVDGRALARQDGDNTPKVAVISETMARRMFPGQSAVGRHFGLGGIEHSEEFEIVGVVKDAKYQSLAETGRIAAYYPRAQRIQYMGNFVVRYSGSALAVTPLVRNAIKDIDPKLPISNVTTLAGQVEHSVGPQRMIARLCGLFGFLAVLLACLGIYGLMSHAVARRTQEIGVRLALGAGKPAVLWLVLSETLKLGAIGVVIGVPVALGLGKLVENQLFGVKPTGTAGIIIAAAASLLLLLVAALAGFIPARRASRVDPNSALRAE
jgi:predicted permease